MSSSLALPHLSTHCPRLFPSSSFTSSLISLVPLSARESTSSGCPGAVVPLTYGAPVTSYPRIVRLPAIRKRQEICRVKMKGFRESNLPACVVAARVVWARAPHDATSAIAPPGPRDPCAREGYVGSWTRQEVAPPCPARCLQVRCVLVVPFFPHSRTRAARRAFVLCYPPSRPSTLFRC